MRRSVGWIVGVVLVLAALIHGWPASPPITVQTIASLLLHSGDLPAAYTPGQVTAELDPSYYRGHKLAEPMLDVVQHIAPANGWLLGGGVGVLLYADEAAAAATFTTLMEEMATEGTVELPPGIGERAALRTGPETMMPTLRFVRCRAVVHVTLPESSEVMETYAQRLDARLQRVVCP